MRYAVSPSQKLFDTIFHELREVQYAVFGLLKMRSAVLGLRHGALGTPIALPLYLEARKKYGPFVGVPAN